MKHRLLMLLLLCISFLSAIVVNHVPPLGIESNQQLELRIEIVQGWSDVSEAVVFYRLQGEKNYSQVIMVKENPEGLWMKGMLPISASPEKAYEYYFRYTLNSGAVEYTPAMEAEKRPFVVQPKAKSGELSEDFILVSDEGSIYIKDSFILAISWYGLEGVIDTKTVKFFINGKDYTQKANISSSMLIYKDDTPKPGLLTSYVTATTMDGKSIYSKTWTNLLKSLGKVTALPMNLRGSVNAGTNMYSTAKDDNAIAFGGAQDDSWGSLDMYAEYKKLQLQSYTYVSSLEDEKIQHVNRFKLGILLPFWETYVGDYAPDFSSLTMSNKNLRGVYSKLYTKYFGLSFAHGETVRSIDGIKYIDPSNNQTNYYGGTFKQEAIATRMRLGREDGLSFGFNSTRNRDVISSLDKKYIEKVNGQDTTQIAFPKDNLVFSMDTKLSIPAQNIIMGIEGAASLFNSNTYPGPFSTEDLEDYINGSSSIDPSNFQDIFIINTNMQPLPIIDDSTHTIMSYLKAIRSTVKPVFAWQAFLRNYWQNNLINLNYSETGTSFKSLNTSYLQNDVSQLAISDQYNYKQYAFVSGGYNRTKDNLSEIRLETNTYSSLYLQGMLRIPKFPYLTGSFSTNDSKNERNKKMTSLDTLYVDTTMVIIDTNDELFNPYKRNSDMISFGIGYEFSMMPVAPTTLDLGWRTGTDNSESPDTLYVYDNETESISIGLISKFIDIPLKTRISISNSTQERCYWQASIASAQLEKVKKKNTNFNFQLKGEYRLFDNMIVPWAEYRTILLGGDQDQQKYDYVTFGADARPWDTVTLSTSLGWVMFSNDDKEDSDYNITAWHLNASYRF